MPTALKTHGGFPAPTETDRPASYLLTADGFDLVTKTYWCNTSQPMATADTYFRRGQPMPDMTNVIVDSVRITQESLNLFEFTVEGKGLLSEQPLRMIIDTRTETFGGEVGDTPDGHNAVRFEGRFALLTVAVMEVMITTPAAYTPTVGKQGPITPFGMPIPPSNPWTGAVTPVYRYPNGWVLERLNYEQIASANIWACRRDFAYWPEWLPG
jgi:hypothetical protein